MIDRAYAVSVEIGTAATARIFNVSDYYKASFFVITEQIQNSHFPFTDVSLTHVTLLHASFSMYGFDYSRSTLSFTSYPGIRTGNVTTPSTSDNTPGHEVLNNGTKDLLLRRNHCKETIRHLHVKGDICWTQQLMLTCLIV